MCDIGEAVCIEQIQTEQHKENTCPFCAEPEHESRTNDLKNDSKKLRKACHKGDILGLPEPGSTAPGSQQWCVVYRHPETGKEEISEVRNNPHHCIPGRASLKGKYQHPILEVIEKEKGTITGDIGYNVNGQENGIWLPTIIEHFYAGYRNVDPIAGISWVNYPKRTRHKSFLWPRQPCTTPGGSFMTRIRITANT